jgi:hypothetical protein
MVVTTYPTSTPDARVAPVPDETEHVRIPTADLMVAPFLERIYAAAHPCSCGQKWEILRTAIAFPRAWMFCRCPKCGRQKEFEWAVYESGEKTLEGCLRLMGME